MKIAFIRHGKTLGNTKGKYIGITDEPLCQEGIDFIKNKIYPPVEYVYISPMLRCIETVNLIYPQNDREIVNSLCECNFGDFENKNYDELKNDGNYQKWLDSGGVIAFPNGESRKEFSTRCVVAFSNIIHNCKYDSIALVVHGGSIMALLEYFEESNRNFYDWQAKNGCGFIAELLEVSENGEITIKVISEL